MVTVADFAKRMNVRNETVCMWIRKGKLNAEKTSGGHYLLSEKEIEKFKAVKK